MKRFTRQEALQLGLKKCYGLVCTKHPELEGYRYVSGGCFGCAKEWVKARRKADPELARKQSRESSARCRALRLKNPPLRKKVLDYGSAYRKANREKVEATKRKWSTAHSELVKLYAKRTRAKNRGVVVANTVKRRLAKIHRTPKWIGPEEQWLMKEAYELAARRTKLLGFAWHVDHIIPLQGKTVSGLHVPNNLQVIPAVVNIRKGNRL